MSSTTAVNNKRSYNNLSKLSRGIGETANNDKKIDVVLDDQVLYKIKFKKI